MDYSIMGLKTSLKNKIKFTNFKILNYLRTELKYYENYKYPTNIYIFKCLKFSCNKEVRSQLYQLKKASGFCASCSAKLTRTRVIQKHQLRPHEAQYNRFLTKAKDANKNNELSYQDFLKFTKIKECHYCGYKIDWKIKNKYNLDRKNDNDCYSIKNCVVCCGLCNFTKRNEFTYEEFILIGKAIKKVRRLRK